jgi:hypothetical protein
VTHTSPISRVRHHRQRLMQTTPLGATQLHPRHALDQLTNQLVEQR